MRCITVAHSRFGWTTSTSAVTPWPTAVALHAECSEYCIPSKYFCYAWCGQSVPSRRAPSRFRTSSGRCGRLRTAEGTERPACHCMHAVQRGRCVSNLIPSRKGRGHPAAPKHKTSRADAVNSCDRRTTKRGLAYRSGVEWQIAIVRESPRTSRPLRISLHLHVSMPLPGLLCGWVGGCLCSVC